MSNFPFSCINWHFLKITVLTFFIISLVIFGLQRRTLSQIKALEILFWPCFIIFSPRINICWATMSRSCHRFFYSTFRLVWLAQWSRAWIRQLISHFFELVSNPIATSRCRLRFNANLFFFDGIPGLFRVQFPAGTAHFSTPFNTQGTTFSWLLLTYSICPRNMVRRKVAEIGLNQKMS